MAQVNPNKPKPLAPKPKPTAPAPAATVAVQVEWQGNAPIKATIGGQEVTLLPRAPATVRLKPDLHAVSVTTPVKRYIAADYLAVQDAGSLTLRLDGETLVMKFVVCETERKTFEKSRRSAVVSVEGDMVRVEGGSFVMGCTTGQGDKCLDREQPSRRVVVNTFFISRYEVTQELWEEVVGSTPSVFKDCAKCPVEYVSWQDVQEFIRKLNELMGRRFRLPTEAEWEYAARGGDMALGTTYAGGSDLGNVAWHRGDSGAKTHLVGQKAPNELGLYDMSGNVLEWCQDRYLENYYSVSGSDNPQGPLSGEARVVRGGSWSHVSECHRVAYRFGHSHSYRSKLLGFRLACSE